MDKKIKIVRMTGGLANRMLQYAFSLYLKEQGYDVYIDNYEEFKYEHENVSWNKIFPYAPLRQASKMMLFKVGGSANIFDKIRRNIFPLTASVWNVQNATSVPTKEEVDNFSYFIGTFQDSSVSEHIKEKIMEAYSLNDFKQGTHNADILKHIVSENSVSIHVRKRDDYIKQKIYQNTCPLEYYLEAIKIIRNKVSNPMFYVFTDNPEWVANNFIDFEYTLVVGNPVVGFGNHYDMQLMSCCKHNIIANSTYSWWGAFLNRNPEKVVIDPRHWFNPDVPELHDLPNKTACKGWILL